MEQLQLDHITRLDRPEDIAALKEIIKSLQIKIERGTPTSASALAIKNTIKYDDNYFYIAVDTNTWKRVALSSW